MQRFAHEAQSIKPFFVFSKDTEGRDVIFRGIAMPGELELTSFDDLQAIWKFNENQRLWNYRALFTILGIPVIERDWLNDLNDGRVMTSNTPQASKDFYERVYTGLLSPSEVSL